MQIMIYHLCWFLVKGKLYWRPLETNWYIGWKTIVNKINKITKHLDVKSDVDPSFSSSAIDVRLNNIQSIMYYKQAFPSDIRYELRNYRAQGI